MEMTKFIFNELIKHAVCDTGDDLNCVGFSSSYHKWSAGFYRDENGQFNYEDFGFDGTNGFIEYKPTEEQITRMQLHIDTRINDIENGKRNEELEDRSERSHNKWLWNTCMN